MRHFRYVEIQHLLECILCLHFYCNFITQYYYHGYFSHYRKSPSGGGTLAISETLVIQLQGCPGGQTKTFKSTLSLPLVCLFYLDKNRYSGPYCWVAAVLPVLTCLVLLPEFLAVWEDMEVLDTGDAAALLGGVCVRLSFSSCALIGEWGALWRGAGVGGMASNTPVHR